MSTLENPTIKRKRGRPRKNPLPELLSASLVEDPLYDLFEDLLKDPVEKPTEHSQDGPAVSHSERPKLPCLVGYEFNTRCDLFLTLQYNRRKRCLCHYQSPVKGDVNEVGKRTTSFDPASYCPYHGYDNKSKTPTQKTSSPGQGSNKKRRSGIYDDYNEDQDYTPRQRQRKSRVLQQDPSPPAPARQQTKRIRLNETVADHDYSPQTSARTIRATQQGPSPIASRWRPKRMTAEEPTQNAYDTELRLMRTGIRQTLIDCYSTGPESHSIPDSEPVPLTRIDFFTAPLEARKLIYRHILVPSSGTIFFPSLSTSQTFKQLNPQLQTDILFAHPQLYAECRSILYGENTFTVEDPVDLFQPTGIQGLRPSTARRIKHISILRQGGTAGCKDNITSEEVANSIHHMTIQSPAFLGLQSITIRFEVSRPLDLNLFHLQMYVNRHNPDVDVQALYVKAKFVEDAAARVAYKAQQKGSPFRGLTVENTHHTIWNDEDEGHTLNVYQACLFRSKDSVPEHKKEKATLRTVVLNMLAEDTLSGIQGADERLKSYFKKYPD